MKTSLKSYFESISARDENKTNKHKHYMIQC